MDQGGELIIEKRLTDRRRRDDAAYNGPERRLRDRRVGEHGSGKG